MALQHAGPSKVGAAGQQTASIATQPISSWNARGSMIGNESLLTQARALLAKQTGGATVEVMYAGSVYGHQGEAVVARWNSSTGWKVGFITSPLVGLEPASAADDPGLALRSILSVPDGVLPAYVGFVAKQATRDGGYEALAFALSAPSVGSGSFRVATMESPDSDQSVAADVEDGVSATIVSAEASPWNTYLNTTAGAFGLLGSVPEGPVPGLIEPTSVQTD